MKKILIIEDDKDISLSLAVRLKSKGYQISTAEDAWQGVQNALREQPDLILLDIGMPGGGGFSVIERLASNPNAPMTPVIVLTASRQPEIRERAEAYGVSGYFEKPYNAEELLETIGTTLAAAP